MAAPLLPLWLWVWHFSVNSFPGEIVAHRSAKTSRFTSGEQPPSIWQTHVRTVVQRVTTASVSVSRTLVAHIGPGLCVLLGIAKNDRKSDADVLWEKIKNLRIFEDEQGRMNLPITSVAGEILVVSQFTLYGDCRKGNRPSFSQAAPPQTAEVLYDYFVRQLRSAGLRVATGRFGAKMALSLVNDGPVTLILES